MFSRALSSISSVLTTHVGRHRNQDLGFRALAMATISLRQANEELQVHAKGVSSFSRGSLMTLPLREISPKLHWKDFHILSAVSRTWEDAIRKAVRSREVYDARVLSNSTEEFLIVNLHLFRGGIGLWSTRDNSLLKLPRIRHRSQHLVSFDGCIYLLGREEQGVDTQEELYDSIISDEVFVLDVAAGERRWRKCASMREERRYFTGAVIDGKIYVCGGDTIERGKVKFCGSEVYNPKKDVWSPIKPMAERYYHQTEAVGEELFVHSGQSKSRNDLSSCLNVYHPGKDEWRVVSPFRKRTEARFIGREDLLFVARGKLHSVDKYGVKFYNEEENSWTELHTFSFSCIEPGGAVYTGDEGTAVVHVDGELLIRYRVRGIDRNGFIKDKNCLAKSIGFGGENKEIVWEKVPLARSREKLLEYTRELTTIRL